MRYVVGAAGKRKPEKTMATTMDGRACDEYGNITGTKCACCGEKEILIDFDPCCSWLCDNRPEAVLAAKAAGTSVPEVTFASLE